MLSLHERSARLTEKPVVTRTQGGECGRFPSRRRGRTPRFLTHTLAASLAAEVVPLASTLCNLCSSERSTSATTIRLTPATTIARKPAYSGLDDAFEDMHAWQSLSTNIPNVES